jgi:PAS domain S-box-containing protein
MHIDIQTLSIVLALASVLQAIAIFFQYSLNKNYKGVNYWVWGFVLMAAGFILLSLRNSLTIEFVSIVLARFLLISGSAAFYIGILRFLGKKENWKFIISFTVVFLLAYTCFTYLIENVSVRGILFSLAIVTFSFLAARQLFARQNRFMASSAYFLGAVLYLQAAFFIFRGVDIAFVTPSNDLFDSTLIQALTFLMSLVINILMTFGLIIMVSQRQSQELTEAKGHFEVFFTTAPDSTIIAQIDDGLIMDANQKFIELMGYAKNEIIGKTTLETGIWPDPAERRRFIKELKTKGQVDLFEAVLKRKNCDLFLAEIHANIINLRGQPYVITTMRDITQEKRLRNELLESETRFHSIYESSPIGIELFDENGLLIEVNKALLDINGIFDGSVIKGVSLYKFPGISPELIQLVKENKEVRFQSIFDFDQLKITKEFKSYRSGKSDIDVIITPIKYSTNSNASGYLVQVNDVTERKKAEDLLKQSEEKYRLLIENSHDIISTFNPDGEITFVSPAWTSLLRHPSEYFIGKHFHEFIHPDDIERTKSLFQKVLETGQPQTNLEYRIPGSMGGWVWYLANVVPLKSESGAIIGFQASAMDISERKKLEEDVKGLYEKEKLERLNLEEAAQTRIRYLDILAHELRGPLSPMLASSEMLANVMADNPDENQKRLADNIYKGTQILVNRLEDLLDIARFARGVVSLNPTPTNIPIFIEQIVSRYLSAITTHNQQLITEIATDLPEIYLDQSRMEQVLINLLSNASKYSPEGTQIVLRAIKHENNLLISIKDSGIGISLEEQTRLFQPYQRLGQGVQKTQGLGLGLTVVKYIIEAHGGKIWVTSEPGKGSTFSFIIPLNSQPGV